MNLQKILVNAVLTGFALALLWVVFWAFFVPEVTPILTWSGYEGLVVPVFFVGLAGGAAWELRPRS